MILFCATIALMSKDLKQKIVEAVETSPYRDYIQSISIFGSYLHGDQKSDSDIDLIVLLKSGIGLFEFVGIQQDFEKKLGRKVDLVTPDGLSKYIRKEVLNEAKRVYEKK